MPVRINGASSGYVELAAPAVAGSTSLTLPATSGTVFLEPGAWASYTPTLTNITLGNGSLSGAYTQIGKTIIGRILFKMGSTSGVSGQMRFGLPVTPKAFGTNANLIFIGTAYGEDAGTAGYYGQVAIIGDGSNYCWINTPSTTNPRAVFDNWQASVPFAWGNGDFLEFQFTYEAA